MIDLSAPGIVHATAVSAAGRALLLVGRSGAGKSALALRMIALGAGLIADDRTDLSLRDGVPVAACPPTIRGRIEARGLGILEVPPAPPAPVVAVVDLDTAETARLPESREVRVIGQKVSLLHGLASDHFPAALLLYLRGGMIR